MLNIIPYIVLIHDLTKISKMIYNPSNEDDGR